MKVLKALVVVFAIVGCLAIAAAGYYVFTRSGNLFQNPMSQKPAAGETTATAAATPAPRSNNPENNTLLAEFQKTAETPAPAAGGSSAVGSVAAALAAKPVRTPGATDPSAIREWPTGRKQVALTFDDGPHPEWTPKFMDLLRSKNVKATFFVIGPNMEKHPEIGKLLADYGFEIGNHTMTHPQFRSKSVEAVREELGNTNEIIKSVSGVKDVTIMRPPFGQYPKNVQEVTKELGLRIVTWNIDTDDWRATTNEDRMTSLVMEGLKDGAIILMHDRSEKAYNTTARIIDDIRAKGYEFVTVSELLGLTPHQKDPALAGASSGEPAAGPSSDAGTEATGQAIAQSAAALPVPPATASEPAAPAADAAPGQQESLPKSVTTTPPARR